MTKKMCPLLTLSDGKNSCSISYYVVSWTYAMSPDVNINVVLHVFDARISVKAPVLV